MVQREKTPKRDLELIYSDVLELRKNFKQDLGATVFALAPTVALALPGVGFTELLREGQIDDPLKGTVAGGMCILLLFTGARISFGHLNLAEKFKHTLTSFSDYITEKKELVGEAVRQEGLKGLRYVIK
ncbi:MAG: hypothetical protein V1744_02280 [Candidatus Altiarchaeota archaeon]